MEQEDLIKSFSFVYSLPEDFSRVDAKGAEKLTELVRVLGLDLRGFEADFQDKLYVVKSSIFDKLLKNTEAEIGSRLRLRDGESEQEFFARKYKTFGARLLGIFTFDDNIDRIADDVNELFIHNIIREFKHEGRIRNFIGQAFPEQSVEVAGIEKNDQQTANSDSAHIVRVRVDGVEKKLYVKSCGEGLGSVSHKDKKIDPRELLLYKVLEYVGLGPKVYFIIKDVARSYMGSVARGSYILTEEIVGIKIDNETNREVFLDFMRSPNREDAIELSRASLIVDLLSLSDVFEDNTRNYGLISKEGRSKIVFVDHLPGNNGILSCIDSDAEQLSIFSPRQRVAHRLGLLTAKDSGLKGNPSYANDGSGIGSWAKRSLATEVTNDVFSGKDGFLPFLEAVDKAKADIERLIRDNGNSFTELGSDLLKSYLAKIRRNVETYKKTEYYLSSSCGSVP